jgi:hypothetical protein
MIAMSACSSSRQRGAAALFVVVMLCFAMVLVAALAQRNVVVEEQRSANELRSRIAFAAADAGLEWALARINDPTPIGATCLPSADPAATSFAPASCASMPASGAVTPTTWNDGRQRASIASGLHSRQRRLDVLVSDEWPAALPAVDGGALAPAFFVELAASSRPGVVRASRPDARRQPSLRAAHRPTRADARRPRASKSRGRCCRAALGAGCGAHRRRRSRRRCRSLGVANVDAASGGLAVHAGGRVVATALRIDAPPGAPLGGSIAAGDDELRALGADRLFARHFGMPPRVWAAQPAGRHVVCGDDCTAAIAAAVAGGARLLFVDGDAALTGPAVLGSADDPLALVASGALTIVGDVAIHGVVHAASLDWRDGATGFAFVHGALVVGGDVRGNASADIVRDAAILDRLAYASGSFVRVDGSWKDF